MITIDPVKAKETWHAPLMVDLRKKRDDLLKVLDGMQASALTLDDQERATLLETMKTGVKNIPANPAILGAADVQAFKVAAITAYAQVVGTAPAPVKAAFKEYLK